MDRFLLLCFVCVLVAGVNSTEVYKDETGDIESYSTGSKVIKIIADKGKKVVLEFTEMNLNPSDLIKIRDGQYGISYSYTMSRGVITERKGDSWSSKIVRLPIRFQTTDTRKIFILHKAVGSGAEKGFSAHYTSFMEQGNCRKENLEYIFHDILDVTCDTDSLSPVASRCDVTLNCGSNYKQYSTTVTCDNEEWEGDIKCQPRADLMELCVYDFDELTTSEECPYTVDEAISFYLEVENVETEDEGGAFGRSTGSNCPKWVCQRRYNGRFVRRSCGRRGSRAYVKCLICRFRRGGCNFHQAFGR